MNLRQIEAFKAMMEAGTVTEAALRLRISQPAMSKLLQYFERAAGMALFTRDRGRLSPTPEAQLLYDQVEQVFQGEFSPVLHRCRRDVCESKMHAAIRTADNRVTHVWSGSPIQGFNLSFAHACLQFELKVTG